MIENLSSDNAQQKLSFLLQGLVNIQKDHDVLITGIHQNSNAIKKGDLFIAIPGIHTHGLKYADQAVSQGAAAIAWEPTEEIFDDPSFKIPCIKVTGLRKQTGFIASRFYSNPSECLQVVGITGTDGKTSVAGFVAQILDNLDRKCGLIGTLGYGHLSALEKSAHTTPEANIIQNVLYNMVQLGDMFAVLEASSHGLSQYRLNGVSFDIAVLTNIGNDHSDYHQSKEDYVKAKQKLFEISSLKTAILNIDDHFGQHLSKRLSNSDIEVHTCSTSSKVADVFSKNIQYTREGLEFDVVTPWGASTIKSPLFGEFNIQNLLLSIATLCSLKVDYASVVKVFPLLMPVRGRMNKLTSEKQVTIFVDYAHTPQALGNALCSIKQHFRSPICCVFGCGGDRDAKKRPLMAKVAEQYAQRIIVTDDNTRTENPEGIVKDIIAGFTNPQEVSVVHDRATAIRQAISTATVSEVVLVAGKGHEEEQIVGEEKHPFNDMKFIQEVLQEIGQ